ncbi:hypothetical protein C8T65DRAFT_745470 [Cerioporus squamosus]|nr:hypothetical protein C8T65DRAFT_745470 [Cerioporus squamosus]
MPDVPSGTCPGYSSRSRTLGFHRQGFLCVFLKPASHHLSRPILPFKYSTQTSSQHLFPASLMSVGSDGGKDNGKDLGKNVGGVKTHAALRDTVNFGREPSASNPHTGPRNDDMLGDQTHDYSSGRGDDLDNDSADLDDEDEDEDEVRVVLDDAKTRARISKVSKKIIARYFASVVTLTMKAAEETGLLAGQVYDQWNATRSTRLDQCVLDVLQRARSPICAIRSSKKKHGKKASAISEDYPEAQELSGAASTTMARRKQG